MAKKMSDEDFDKLLKEALPVIDAMEAPPSSPPPEVLQRLEVDRLKLVEAKRQQEPAPEPQPNPLVEFFQWLLAPARLVPVFIACAAVLVLCLFIFKSQAPLVQLAMLDTVGATRGSTSKVVAVLQGDSKAQVQQFSESTELKRWLGDWPADDSKTVVKIVYDRDSGDVRVMGHIKGKPSFEKTFSVQREEVLPAVLKAAQAFIEEQTR